MSRPNAARYRDNDLCWIKFGSLWWPGFVGGRLSGLYTVSGS